MRSNLVFSPDDRTIRCTRCSAQRQLPRSITIEQFADVLEELEELHDERHGANHPHVIHIERLINREETNVALY